MAVHRRSGACLVRFCCKGVYDGGPSYREHGNRKRISRVAVGAAAKVVVPVLELDSDGLLTLTRSVELDIELFHPKNPPPLPPLSCSSPLSRILSSSSPSSLIPPPKRQSSSKVAAEAKAAAGAAVAGAVPPGSVASVSVSISRHSQRDRDCGCRAAATAGILAAERLIQPGRWQEQQEER
jgi:hypothetical protein